MPNPQHTHDCTACVFLGRLCTVDLYCCPKSEGIGASYIVRYSSEGPDYYSTCDFRDKQYAEEDQRYGHPDHWSATERIRFLRRVTAIKLCSVALINLIDKGEEYV